MSEVEQMKKDAEAHAEEDLRRKELIEVAQPWRTIRLMRLRKRLKEFGDKVPAEVKSEIEAKVAEVRKAVEGEDVEAIKAATEELGQLIQKIGASVYEVEGAASGSSDAEPDPSSDESDEEVIDGEVKE